MAALTEILPTDEEEFTTVQYWDRFYALREDAAFEWYVDGARAAALVLRALGDGAAAPLVVNLGGGTCTFPRAFAAAWRGASAARVLSVDTSAPAVAAARAAQAAAATAGCALDFAVGDALALADVGDGAAAALLDKGLVDALHPRDDAERRATMARLFATARRVLRPGGTFVVVSMLQAHVRALLRRVCDDGGCAVAVAPAARADAEERLAVSRKPRENPGFFDFGGPYLGQFGSDSATVWTVDHLCTSSRDLDTKIARIDSYKVMLK